MTNYKRYPHVPCDSVVLKLDEVVLCLKDYLGGLAMEGGREDMKRMAAEGLKGLEEVISRRGKVLSVQRRRRGMSGMYMTIR